jgi:hypothetical protein
MNASSRTTIAASRRSARIGVRGFAIAAAVLVLFIGIGFAVGAFTTGVRPHGSVSAPAQAESRAAVVAVPDVGVPPSLPAMRVRARPSSSAASVVSKAPSSTDQTTPNVAASPVVRTTTPSAPATSRSTTPRSPAPSTPSHQGSGHKTSGEA